MKKQMDMSIDAKIGLKERLAYTLGGGGVNMSLAVLGLLLTYYTMVLKIPAGTATMVIGISKLLDGLSDLVMGWIVDHTHTKNGKAKPWLFRMAFPTAIAVIAAFMVPTSWSTPAQVVYMFVTYNLSTTICVTAIAVPFSSLNGYMTTD
jgi:GPH family glycoside/pentoside/hexuronide:cation symporter